MSAPDLSWITPEHVIQARRSVAASGLVPFIKMAWHVLEPGQEYKHGRHIDVIAEHLEAAMRGEIRRLSINVPPGSMKSLMCGVFLPAWMWGPMGMPSKRFLGVAHEQGLGVRDNMKCRRLIESPWYQKTWGDTVRLAKDQNEKQNFENTAKGWRAVATPSNITGKRADVVTCDDLISVENANSEVERERVNRWYEESLPTRLNNPDSSVIINIMQRVHERDVSGLLLEKFEDYEHVILPMEFEPDRQFYTSLGKVDWRTEPGELLFPERFPESVLEEYKKSAYAWASQHQQRPAPRDGGLFKPSWFEIIDAAPAGGKRTVRAWDLAATKKAATNNPDWTAGLRMSRYDNGWFVIEGVKRLRGSPLEVEQTVIQTAASDGSSVVVRMTQDPGQAGKAQAEQFVRKLAGYPVVSKPATGDKATRATPAAAQAEVGNIKILRTGDPAQDAWVTPFLDEVALFPAGAHDDQVDVLADAVNELALGSRYNIAAW